MKKNYFALILIFCAILTVLLLKEDDKGKSGPKEALERQDTGATVLIKYAGIDQTEYYELEGWEELFERLEIENWTPIETAGNMAKPYLVIRIGENYEVVLSDAGMVYIENLYAIEEEEKEGCYMTSIELESILEYLEKEADLCDCRITFNH